MKTRIFLLLAALLFAASAAQAQQTGSITGRVVTEDDAGMPGVTVMLGQVAAGRTPSSRSSTAMTDEDGNFTFRGLAPRVYFLNALESKGHVSRPVPVGERIDRRGYRIGETVTLTMMRGGVITGRVTSATGEPMIGVQVSPIMVKDAEGNPIRGQVFGGRSRGTDDRGVYRLYGLAPGTYIITTQNFGYGPGLSAYDGDAPTYHPSATRDTAAEIAVTGGGEATGIDIRYRGERGHAVSGTVSGVESPRPLRMNVILYSVPSGAVAGSTGVRPDLGNNGFALYGVPDGEYELVAWHGSYDNEDGYLSPPRRVTIRGADVGGIELKLAPLAAIAGKFAIEASPKACESKRKYAMEEIVAAARRDAKPSESYMPLMSFRMDGAATETGEFNLRDLEPGRYFLESRLPNENWFVKSISASAGRAGIPLKAGEKVTGITVTIADGAAGLRGRVVPAKAGGSLPTRMRVHLIQAEAAAADEVLRYAETLARGDGSFAFGHLAPGRYWLLARIVPDSEPADRPPAPVAFDAIERAKVRKDAEAKKVEIELKSCQIIKDYKLGW